MILQSINTVLSLHTVYQFKVLKKKMRWQCQIFSFNVVILFSSSESYSVPSESTVDWQAFFMNVPLRKFKLVELRNSALPSPEKTQLLTGKCCIAGSPSEKNGWSMVLNIIAVFVFVSTTVGGKFGQITFCLAFGGTLIISLVCRGMNSNLSNSPFKAYIRSTLAGFVLLRTHRRLISLILYWI